MRRTLIEGALLTVLIVFLFLNSWRSTVITGLTLPISLIGTFLFMNLFGFTINMITLMALSLCVGLLIDDAIVVRENIVRHVQMGKKPYDAAMDGTQEIGLAVLATTLSIVAVFLPIGFMGGIIGKFFHEFGITIVAAVLISMFVSFTLDPMLSSIWHDPSIEAHGKRHAPVTFYDKTIGRVTGWFDHATDWLGDAYQGILRWALQHRLATVGLATVIFVTSLFMVPLLGTEFVPKSDFSETTVNFYTPVGSSLEVTEAKARQVEAIIREFPEVNYTLATINTANALGKINASIYVRLVDRNQRKRSVDEMAARAARAAAPGAGHHRHPRRPARPGRWPEADRVLAPGPRPARTRPPDPSGDGQGAPDPGSGGPGFQHQARQADHRGGHPPRCGVRTGPGREPDRRSAAHPGRRPDRRQLARQRRPDL